MPAPLLPALKLALPLLRVAGPHLARSLPFLRQLAPVAVTLRCAAGWYNGLAQWWLAYEDGILTAAEKRAIWAAVLAVELCAVTVAREVWRAAQSPYWQRWRR